MGKLSAYHVSVSSTLRGYHLGYIANMQRIIKEIGREYDLTPNEVKIIAYLSNLLDIRHASKLKTSLPTYSEFIDSIDFIHRQVFCRSLIKLCDRGFIKWMNKPGAKDHNTYKAARFYDVGPEGAKVLKSYSGKMARYYKRNYYTDQIERDHERIKLMIEQDQIKLDSIRREISELKGFTAPHTPEDETKDNANDDILRLFGEVE